jgi:predicted transcriptional regulator
MSTSVRSTVIIDDDLFRRAKEQAARQNTTLSAVVNQALRQALDRPSAEAPVFHMVTFGDPGVRVDHEPAEFAAALEQDDFRCPRG